MEGGLLRRPRRKPRRRLRRRPKGRMADAEKEE